MMKRLRGQEVKRSKKLFIFLIILSTYQPINCLFATSLHSLSDYGEVKDFSFVERSGKELTRNDLLGKVWVANFIFTRCKGPCPLLTRQMAELQRELPPEIHFVSFSVDPEFDTPQVLSKYAESYGADKSRWLFLTGKKKEMYDFIRKSFHLTVEEDSREKDPGYAFIHSLRFALVDERGQVRSYYHGEDAQDLKRIGADIKTLSREKMSPLILKLPSLNALLNSLSALLLISGYLFIRKKKILAHKISMGSAFCLSILFLTSYLIYHFHVGSVPFTKQGWLRPLYFTILISHTILAVAIVPLALTTLYQAWRGNFTKHVKVARWTLPLWLYVSVTGVTVYWMLYRM